MSTSLSAHDPRILRELNEAFPGSPEFASYIARRLCRTNGSLVLVRLMIHYLLNNFPTIPIVTEELVNRLGVDEDINAIGRINQVQLEKRSEVLSSAILFRLAVEKEEKESGAIDFDHMEDYHHIFWCACAMLSGLAIDPRKEQVA